MTGLKEKVICPECFGEGLNVVECDDCGQDKEDGCSLCEGHGLIRFGKLDSRQKQKCFPLSDYHQEAENDLLAYAHWMGKSFVETCMDFGFSVCSRICNKKETCLFPDTKIFESNG